MEGHEAPPSGEDELRAESRYWENPEYREKYSDKERATLAKKGIGYAMPDGSYPTNDRDDVDNAVHAVGRGGAEHDDIRRHIIAAAKRLGCMDLIPDSWNSDGSLKQTNSADTAAEQTQARDKVTNRALTATAERRRRERHRKVPLFPEVRHFRAEGLEVRSNAKTDEIVITGAPIVYERDYSVTDALGQFTERMAPGVATDVLPKADVRFLFNHDGLPLARTAAGTMSLTDSDAELRFTACLDARQQLANDLAIAIQRGDVSQMSCGFIVAQDEWSEDWEDRTIHRFADLLDVSAVTYPASPTTSIEVAHRMALQMPVESRARVRKAVTELRAGKALSAANQDKLVQGLTHLLDLASGAGVDLSSLDPDHDGDVDTLEPDVDISSDGTEGGSDAPESGVGADGFPVDQTRAAEPGEPIQYLGRAKVAVTQAWLEDLVERGEDRHGEARKRVA